MPDISGFSEMSQAQLHHRRRNKGAARLFERLASNHSGSFSFAVGNAGRQAAHRLFAAEKVTPASMISGHMLATLKRARLLCPPGEWLHILQDTTDFEYTTHQKTTGLGSVGQGFSSGKGLQSHSALAVTQDGLPLGVVDLVLWARDFPEPGTTKEERHKISKAKSTDQKESKKWLECIQRVQANTPADLKLLFVQDREADMFELFEEPRRPGTDLLVRAAQPRIVEIVSEDPHVAGGVSHVFKAVQSAPVLGQFTVVVSATKTAKARTAVVVVRACSVLLRAPTSRLTGQNHTPRAVWLVSAREADPPEGAERVDWTLISTIPASTFEEACRLVTFYTRRWLIERLHFVLKSGLRAEDLRLDDAHSLQNALALYYVVAWRLLHLTYLARKDPDQPAADSFEEQELEILCLLENKPIRTISAAVVAIAKLGGYNSYPKAAPPGVKTLWLGLRKLEAILIGYRLALRSPQEVNH